MCIRHYNEEVAVAPANTMLAVSEIDEGQFNAAFQRYFNQSVFYTIWGALSQGIHLREIWTLQQAQHPRTESNEKASTIVDCTASCFVKLLWVLTKNNPQNEWPVAGAPLPRLPASLYNDLQAVQQLFANRTVSPLMSPVDVPITQYWTSERKPRGGLSGSDPSAFLTGHRGYT